MKDNGRLLSSVVCSALGFAALLSILRPAYAGAAVSDDASAMRALKAALSTSESLGWSDPNPCEWNRVGCSADGRVTRIQIGHLNLEGVLPPEIRTLTQLERLEVHWNRISGPLPTLSGLSFLQVVMLSNNMFESIPPDFFSGMSSLQSVNVDNNPFTPWMIPETLQHASSLQNFSANSANLRGSIPGFFSADTFPGLTVLHLAFNDLQGGLPESLRGSQIQSLWLNGQKNKLTGSVDVLRNMTMLQEVWLHSNGFSGSLPDFSSLSDLKTLSLRDNMFTGPIPLSVTNLDSLRIVNLTNNLFQGPTPVFKSSVSVDMVKNSNSFCMPIHGDCDPRVAILLSIIKSFGYPLRFAENWKGNNPCANWIGITCRGDDIIVVNFQKFGLNGTISPEFAAIRTLRRLILADNNLTGEIPRELASVSGLKELDVSNNRVAGVVPRFGRGVRVKLNGNAGIGKSAGSSSSSSRIHGGSIHGDSANCGRNSVLGFTASAILSVSVLTFFIF